MKVVAYSIRESEKEGLAKANHKKHDITLISNTLGLETLNYAEGKNAVLVFTDDDVSASIIHKLADLGIKYICTRSVSTDHINLEAAKEHGIQIANISFKTADQAAEACISNLDKWQSNTCLGNACVCSRSCRGNALDTPPKDLQ